MIRYLVCWLAIFFIHHLFVALFAGIQGVTAVGLALGLGSDIAWATLFASLFSFLKRLPYLAGRALGGFLLVLLPLFLMVSFGFAKLYQRPFSFSFVRLDTGTIWKENFVSGLYELSWPHLLLLVFTLGLLFLASRLRPAWMSLSNTTRYAMPLVATAAIVVLLTMVQRPAELISNPLHAALQRRGATQAMTDLTVQEGDFIPTLESPEPAPFLPRVRAKRAERRNVILYYLESTPFSAIGKKLQGKEVTPHLNRLSEKSIFFRRHYANFPLSINAFYNSFCSAYALPDGAWISLAMPDFPVPCLSELLGKQGYRSAALHAGYLGYAKQKRFMQKRGFSLLMDAETIKKPPYDQGMGPWGAADERAMIRPLTEFAAKDTANPFLALMFAFAPHHPYDMPDGFPELITAEPGMKRSQVRFFNSLHYADQAFGEILTALEKSGVLKNSILIVFGDHGEAFYEHPGNYNHPFYIYEENIHVPLMIWYEGVEAQKVERVTSHVDILPTVLDLLGYENLSSPLHVGRSMLRVGAQSLAHLQAFWQEDYSGIVDHRMKYIRRDTGSEELFDLSADAGEKNNLMTNQPQLTAVYRALTGKSFAQKKAYYKKYGNYELTRFNPASQDK
ncbi:MAG: LTA synthase family protein [Turneriella sp.]